MIETYRKLISKKMSEIQKWEGVLRSRKGWSFLLMAVGTILLFVFGAIFLNDEIFSAVGIMFLWFGTIEGVLLAIFLPIYIRRKIRAPRIIENLKIELKGLENRSKLYIKNQEAISEAQRIDLLNKSKKSLDDGIITKEEFENIRNDFSILNERNPNEIVFTPPIKTKETDFNSKYSEDEKVELLLKYKTLLDSGVLTQEEFEAKKKEIL